MKYLLCFLMSFSILSFSNPLRAQKKEAYPIETIKAYKNALNKKVAKRPIEVELILDLPYIKLYRGYSKSYMNTNLGPMAGGVGTMRAAVDVSDTFWYCIRPGEEVATIVSWTFNTQVNKNTVFRKNAKKYFIDYPELHRKIDDREFKYDEILEVVSFYNDWKSGE